MPLFLLLIQLLFAATAASAHPLEGLENCGVEGRRLKIENSDDQYLPNGDYLLVTKMEFKKCNRWDWLFLVDEELFKRMSQALKTNTQLILGAPSSISSEGEDYELFGMALKAGMGNFKNFRPQLDDSKHGLLVTPKSSLYTFFHELRHIGDYLTRGDKIYWSMMDVGMDVEQINASILFILEASAYAEQVRKMFESRRPMEYAFRGHQTVFVHGHDERQRETLFHRGSFREFYAQPMRTLMDSLKRTNPEKFERLMARLKPLITARDLMALDVHRMFPELTLSAANGCESKLL